ncbi:Lrp/AsnC family transcriptional regulator [Pedobacter sp. PAMC26386]|nr:Lrp/AsnC family transcriptional regulator [Pedobacter sp. PAMC26386]
MNKKSALELDGFDIAILNILQLDNTTPQREIGDTINLSAAAVNRRIKRMQDTGVIQANVAVINPAKVGHPITLIIEVEIENEQINFIEEAKEKFITCAEVQQCFYVTGEADFILIISVANMEEYGHFTKRMFFRNSNVKRFKTFVTMDRVKVGLSISLNG